MYVVRWRSSSEDDRVLAVVEFTAPHRRRRLAKAKGQLVAMRPARALVSATARLAPRARLIARKMSDDRDSTAIEDLLAKFRDPTSHYHLPAGTAGPSHDEDHTGSRLPPGLAGSCPHPELRQNELYSPLASGSASSEQLPDLSPSGSSSLSSPSSSLSSPSSSLSSRDDSLQESRALAQAFFKEEGYDPRGTLEWPVAWGDCDMFRHVNNVQYVRWVESARIRYTESWDDVLPRDTIYGLLSGTGMGYILRDVAVRFKAPVTYPDNVVIASKVHSIDQARARFKMASAIWSLQQRRVVATAESTLVMFDYDQNERGTMSDELRATLQSRMPNSDVD